MMNPTPSIEKYCSSIGRLYNKIDSLYAEKERNDTVENTCNDINSSIDYLVVENKLEEDCQKAISEEEIKAVISVEEESRIASFATKHKLSKRVLELYYISAKLKAYSKESKVNSSSCPEKIAMVYLYRDRRDRFECVHSLINLYMSKLSKERENVFLMKKLKTIISEIVQRGYVKMVVDLIRYSVDHFQGIDDCYLLLILDELQAALKSLLSLFQLIRISKDELLKLQTLYLVVKQSQQFASIASLLYTLMIDAIMAMPPFTSRLEYANTQPNLFDSANIESFVNDLKNKQYYSLLLFVIMVSTVEYKQIASSESMINLCLHNNELTEFINCLHSLSFVSDSNHLQSECYQILLQFIKYCIQFYLHYPSSFYCEASIREQLNERGMTSCSICDGVETFIQCIEMVLRKATISEPIPLLFELMLSLIASIPQQPHLFDTTVQYIGHVAHINTNYQAEVYSLLQQSTSPFIGLPCFYSNLESFLSHLNTTSQPLEEDYKGMEGILSVFSSLIHHNPVLREEVMRHTHHQLISMLVRLLPFSHPPSFLAAVFQVLQYLAEYPDYAMSIWKELSRGIVIANTARYNNNVNRITSGLELLFTSTELERGEFCCTSAFVSFFFTLLQNCDFTSIVTTPIFVSYLSFIFYTVFIGTYHHTDHSYKIPILTNCLRILHYCVKNTVLTKTPIMMSLIAELLSSSQLINVVLSLQTLEYHPYPILPVSKQISPVSESMLHMNLASSQLLLELLSISSDFIKDNHIVLAVPGMTQLAQPLSQQLLLNPEVFMKILLCLENTFYPELQLVTLQIFSRVIEQIPTPSLLSFFTNYISETELIHGLICSLFTRAILHHDKDKEYACCIEVLKVLISLASHDSSLLFLLVRLNNPDSLVHSLIEYAECMEMLVTYPELVGLIFYFLTSFIKLQTKENLLKWISTDFVKKAIYHCHMLTSYISSENQSSSKGLDLTDPSSILHDQGILFCHTLDNILLFLETFYFLLPLDNEQLGLAYLDATATDKPVSSLLQEFKSFIYQVSLSTHSIFFQQYSQQARTRFSFWNISFEALECNDLPQFITDFCKQNNIRNIDEVCSKLESECRQINRDLFIQAIQDSILSHYFNFLHILIIDHRSASETVLVYYVSLLDFFNQPNIRVSIQKDIIQLLLAILIHCMNGKNPLTTDQINKSIRVVTEAITKDNAKETEELRSVEYYYLLKLFNVFSITVKNKQLCLQIIENLLPSLLSKLVNDLSNQTATLLLQAIVSFDSTSAVAQYLISQTDLVMKLLQTIQSIDISLLSSPESLKTTQLLLSLMVVMADQTPVAMHFLQMSIFASINHNSLFTAIKEDRNALLLTTLNSEQKDSLRILLIQMIQIAIVLKKSVKSIRSIQVELVSFIVTLLPFVSFIFKDKEGSHGLVLELIALYIGLLVIAADSPQRFIQAMNGYENVIRTEIVGLVNVISKKEEICNSINKHIKDNNDSLSPYLMIVENSMLFLSKMGWKIGDEYLRAFGVK